METSNGAFWTRRDDYINGQLLEGGHQRSDLGLLLSFVSEGDIVLDIGAHIGTFTVPLARAVGCGGRVYSFEPTDESYDILIRNIKENDVEQQTTATHSLVTDRDGKYSGCVDPHHTGLAHFELDASIPDGECVPATSLDAWGGRAGPGPGASRRHQDRY